MNIRAAVLLISLPLAWACASAGGGAVRTAPRHDPNVITSEELQGASVSNLYEAIRTLRPQWMERLGPTTFRPQGEYSIMVYMDRLRFGEPEMLRQVPISLPQSVRYLSASEAQAEFGVGNLQGAIQIVTRRPQ